MSNGFHPEHVEDIGDARMLVCRVCSPDDNEDLLLCPAHSIATRIVNAPSVTPKNDSMLVHIVCMEPKFWT